MSNRIFVIYFVSFLCFSCQEDRPTIPIFTLVDNDLSGIDFENTLTNSSDFNVYKYRNFYNGGGVSIGDINNDGLQDIYMTSNMEANQLFLNKGNLNFENITEKAGVSGTRAWSTGSTMIDINSDGYLDIYVCNSGDIKGDNKENELFINNGDGTFSEQGEKFGLNDNGLSTHASFFDYDKDGDLDVYLLNNSFKAIGSFNLKLNQRDTRDPKGGDKLLRNDNGVFVDVSEASGIYGSVIGFGLGITVGDVNNDSWEDIFVSNDFFERDYLYINQKDGTFSEELTECIKSISGASMGADIGDINNDGNQDIFVTEMLPDDPQRLKSVTTFEDWNKYQANVKNGYHHQFTRNTLHLNNGDDSFSEIGRYAGVEASDWSWGALLFDMDNDGYKDLFVANGIYQDLTDQDYLNYIANEEVIKSIVKDEGVDYKKLIDIIPSNPLPNHYYLNNGDATFDRVAGIDIDLASFSNGSAYGDLDNDGDLDLVINNVNMPAMLYKNNANAHGNNYLKVILKGDEKNINAQGAKVIVSLNDSITITQEVQGARGFQSSSDTRLNFGLGKSQSAHVEIIWEEGHRQELQNVNANQTLEVLKSASNNIEEQVEMKERALFLQLDTLEITHTENNYSDFTRERLLYMMKSNEGPAMLLDNLDDNEYEDLIITGAKGDYSKIVFDYGTAQQNVVNLDSKIDLKDAEHVDVVTGDFNNDGLKDIYLASGGSDVSPYSPVLFDHLFFNEGERKFSLSTQKLPNDKSNISTSSVTVADIDQDGDLDIFVGERLKIGNFGAEASGYLLVNEGKGNFDDKTQELIPAVESIGMITDAQFHDLNDDGLEDLILIGEFMSIHFFINDGNGFTEKTFSAQDQLYGWWHTFHLADIDSDGDVDIVAGNHGLNSRFKASNELPISLYYSDFDGNGSKEGILCYRGADGNDHPYHLRHNLLTQMRAIEKRIPDYKSYKGKSMDEIFTSEELEATRVLKTNELRTIILENKGDLNFEIVSLPYDAQLSPIYAITTCDVNGDGDLDLVLGGNQYNSQPEAGIYDASYGLVLENKGNMQFESFNSKIKDMRIEGQIRDFIRRGNQILVARNNDSLLSLEFVHNE